MMTTGHLTSEAIKYSKAIMEDTNLCILTLQKEDIEVIIKNAERDKYAKVIREELVKLSVEFSRYKDRWDKLSRSIQTVSKDVEDIHTTTDKITKRFNSINSVELDEDLKIE